MAKFKIKIEYFDQASEETCEIEADNSSQAALRCCEIKKENESMIENLSQKGIYASKRIKDCQLCRMTMKEELQVCENMFRELLFDDSKNDI